MKRILATLFKALIMMAIVAGGIYLEILLHDQGLKTVWLMLYVILLPALACAYSSKYKRKVGETVKLIFSLALAATALYFVLVGILALIHLIFSLEGKKYFYIIYTILVYLYIPITLSFGKKESGVSTGGGPKSTKTIWAFLLEIHLLGRYWFIHPENRTTLWIVLACVLTLIPLHFGPLRGELVGICDEIYRKIKKVSSKCPNCQNRFELPVYLCPQCGRTYRNLIPDEEGAKTLQCFCGYNLPTSFFNGREKLPALCPHCGADVKDGGLHVDVCIPVVGGASSGKTCFIHQSIAAIGSAAGSYGLQYEYTPNGADDYEDTMEAIRQGYLPEKTNDMRLKYYQFHLNPEGTKVKNLISLCDVGGEVYSDSTTIGEQIGYKYANAFLMVVDPLSVPAYRAEVERQGIETRAYGYSSDSVDAVAGMLITTLENMFCITSKDMLKTDVAIVFSKCDLPGLSEKIGDVAVDTYLSENAGVTRLEAQNAVCEHFLQEYEEENFLNSLKSKFKTIQFFTSSALGHNANGTPFEARGVEDPVLWLIDRTVSTVDLKNKWDKKA